MLVLEQQGYPRQEGSEPPKAVKVIRPRHVTLRSAIELKIDNDCPDNAEALRIPLGDRFGTERSNPSPSSGESVSVVNPWAVCEKPRSFGGGLRVTGDVRRDVQGANRRSVAVFL